MPASATLHGAGAAQALRRAPGRRLALLDCGSGARAADLVRAGWIVTGLDAREANVAAARRRLPGARWHAADIARDETWPLEDVDAALWSARGSPIEQRRVLRRVRRYLVAGGLLLVEEAADAIGLVREAGFAVESVDATTIVARALAQPPEALAVAEWGRDGVVGLDLRYAPDETELLDVSPESVWRELAEAGAAAAAHYPVDDPYGGLRGAAAVAQFHGCRLDPRQVTFSSGVSALLHDLAGLADGGPIAAPELVHPDLAAWATGRGSSVLTVSEPAAARELVRAVRDGEAALVQLDRPGFLGDAMAQADVARVAGAGVPVLVDESPAAYLGAAASAVRLVERVDNLVVLRGFTKAYSWGGLRIGYAVASPAMADRVRELVAPMGAGGPALGAALAMLARADVFERLRERIRERKRETVALLREHGMEVLPSHPDVPWTAVRDPAGRTSAALAAAGIRGLSPVPVPGTSAPRLEVVHLTIPLSDERFALLRELLG